jgi:hypothetical protein
MRYGVFFCSLAAEATIFVAKEDVRLNIGAFCDLLFLGEIL